MKKKNKNTSNMRSFALFVLILLCLEKSSVNSNSNSNSNKTKTKLDKHFRYSTEISKISRELCNIVDNNFQTNHKFSSNLVIQSDTNENSNKYHRFKKNNKNSKNSLIFKIKHNKTLSSYDFNILFSKQYQQTSDLTMSVFLSKQINSIFFIFSYSPLDYSNSNIFNKIFNSMIEEGFSNPVNGFGRVENFYLKLFNTLRQDLLFHLLKIYRSEEKDYDIIFSGVDYGASISILSVLKLLEINIIPTSQSGISIYSFNPFRIGDSEFIKKTINIKRLYKIVNSKDINQNLFKFFSNNLNLRRSIDNELKLIINSNIIKRYLKFTLGFDCHNIYNYDDIEIETDLNHGESDALEDGIHLLQLQNKSINSPNNISKYHENNLNKNFDNYNWMIEIQKFKFTQPIGEAEIYIDDEAEQEFYICPYIKINNFYHKIYNKNQLSTLDYDDNYLIPECEISSVLSLNRIVKFQNSK